MKKVAYHSFLPCLIAAFLLPMLFPSIFDLLGGALGGWMFFLLAFGPSLLAALSLFMPIRRRVECKKCGWNQDYKPLEYQTKKA